MSRALPAAVKGLAAITLVVTGCAPTIKPLPRAPGELPPLPVEQVSITTIPPGPTGPRDSLVTINTSGAPVRVLIPALAEIAGVSVVMDESVRGTVAVRFENVPALEALHAVIEAAGLAIETGVEKPLAESVFRQPPVNVNEATAGVISARFGVSAKLADFIVRSRPVLYLTATEP